MKPFAIEWFGGGVEKAFRRARPFEEDLPWNELDPDAYPADLVERARAAWTYGAYQELCTGAAFSAIAGALIEAGAPIDLTAMASGFVADEMLHVELNARIANALGGGLSPPVDLRHVTPTADGPPLRRVVELAVRTCCVGEAFSVPVLAGTRSATTHPLIEQVLTRIVRDEGPHARLGTLVLEWADPMLSSEDRAHLSVVATKALKRQLEALERLPADPDDARNVHALGWMTASEWRLAAATGTRKVVEPLRRFGIEAAA